MSERLDLPPLPPAEPRPALDASVRRAAHAELEASRGPAWLVVSRRALTRVAVPAAVTAVVVGYLHWAVVAASRLLH